MRVSKPLTRAAGIWIAAAFLCVLAATLLPALGVVVAGPLTSLTIGAAAAWWVRSTSVVSVEEAAGTGAIAGLGAAAAGVLAFIVLGWLLGSDPAFQERVRDSQSESELPVPYEWIAPLVASASGFVGLAAGLTNLLLATAGGALVGLLSTHRRVHQPSHRG